MSCLGWVLNTSHQNIFSNIKTFYPTFFLSGVAKRVFDNETIIIIFIKRFELKSALIIVGGDNENLLRSSRNIPNVKVLKIEGINVYDILRYDTLVMTEESLARAQEVLAN